MDPMTDPMDDARASSAESVGLDDLDAAVPMPSVDSEAVAAVPTASVLPVEPSTPAPRRSRPHPIAALRRTAGGIGAVGVKELRGRMRGRRAFVVLTLYLVLLAGFAWMVQLTMARSYATGGGLNGLTATYATAAIGQGIFAALIMLETLLVVFLAPMATVGSISLEREKQTLDMLVATPITSFSIVFGKLLSALVYVWLLIAASIPLTAVVFVFGGVAPEDLARSYLVLVVTALGLGAFGLCCSSLVKRTQAATSIAIFGVLAISLGTLISIVFWQSAAETAADRNAGRRGFAPAPLTFLNPFLAQADIAPVDALCVSDSGMSEYCRFRSRFVSTSGFFGADGRDFLPPDAIITLGGVNVSGPAPDPNTGVGAPVRIADVVAFGGAADSIWQKTVVSWLVLSVVFLVLAVQFVSPTRRWRLRRRRSRTPSPEAT